MSKHSIKVASCVRGPRPNRGPFLVANNTTMALDWTYDGPDCDEFEIFAHTETDAPGVFNITARVTGNLRTWATGFDDPADARGYRYYIVPVDGDDDPVAPPSNTVNFVAG